MTPAAAFERFGFYAALFILVAVFSALSPAFLTLQNGINILQQTSTIGIMAIGETLVILAGGIDVSVGSILGLGGMISAIVLRDTGVDPVTAIVLGTLSRACRRPLQWPADHRLGIDPFITTLAMLSVVRGVVYIVSNQYNVNIRG